MRGDSAKNKEREILERKRKKRKHKGTKDIEMDILK